MTREVQHDGKISPALWQMLLLECKGRLTLPLVRLKLPLHPTKHLLLFQFLPTHRCGAMDNCCCQLPKWKILGVAQTTSSNTLGQQQKQTTKVVEDNNARLRLQLLLMCPIIPSTIKEEQWYWGKVPEIQRQTIQTGVALAEPKGGAADTRTHYLCNWMAHWNEVVPSRWMLCCRLLEVVEVWVLAVPVVMVGVGLWTVVQMVSHHLIVQKEVQLLKICYNMQQKQDDFKKKPVHQVWHRLICPPPPPPPPPPPRNICKDNQTRTD